MYIYNIILQRSSPTRCENDKTTIHSSTATHICARLNSKHQQIAHHRTSNGVAPLPSSETQSIHTHIHNMYIHTNIYIYYNTQMHIYIPCIQIHNIYRYTQRLSSQSQQSRSMIILRLSGRRRALPTTTTIITSITTTVNFRYGSC